jgi:dTDP-4-amino-4,6-dideoxygalactose transaminase
MALDIGAGDEGHHHPYTFFATAGTIARVGAKPVFVDIDPGSFNISPAGHRTRHHAAHESHHARAPVRPDGRHDEHHGHSRDDTNCESSRTRRRPSAPRTRTGGAACSIGDIGCLVVLSRPRISARSAMPAPCVTNDPVLAAKLMKLRVHGMEPKYYHELIGGNFRLDEIQGRGAQREAAASRRLERSAPAQRGLL